MLQSSPDPRTGFVESRAWHCHLYRTAEQRINDGVPSELDELGTDSEEEFDYPGGRVEQ